MRDSIVVGEAGASRMHSQRGRWEREQDQDQKHYYDLLPNSTLNMKVFNVHFVQSK
ncbi:hypothetical protein [Balneola vulgaris]|uniref:hypothetical protein n=1 Tax=Balneola vulgaris TaxID=287535 RepID=UPI00039F3369|nr:hypothetical protein [Balneola vulgaris]